jgi:hypothetical protein
MRKNIIYSVFCTLIFLSACSTDLDVIGDYKETLVVYGLLDQAQDTQYIKINKAFLGEGNALTYAQIKDSTQFTHALDVKIKRLDNSVVYSLAPANWNIQKDPGVFYSGEQTNVIYYWVTPHTSGILNPSTEYQLTVKNSETGTEVSSKTSLVSDITGFDYPLASSPFIFVIAGPYPNFQFKVKFTSAKNAKIYQPILRLHYTDSTLTGNTTKQLDYFMPSLKTTKATGGEILEVAIAGADFYRYIGNTLQNYNGLIDRKVGRVDLLLISGSDDLNTFVEVNKPSTGIIQEKPEFTNITNGLGLFSSRLYRKPLSQALSTTSYDSLICGQYTGHLKFVNSAGKHPCSDIH